MTDVAETAVVDHGSHDIDITIKRHLQITGQPRKAKLRQWREAGNLRNWRRGDNGWWSRVLSKGACNHRRRKVRRPEAGAVEGGRDTKGDRGGLGEGATMNGLGAGKEQEGQRGDRAEGRQQVVRERERRRGRRAREESPWRK